ncbi:MAG: MFS transporter [Acidobacteria bacterium]|nr:MFS transporter [Acidobacteriota bacterium]MCB9396427.1 MFS transporter [Acidobacteriota bacterium]
MAVSRVDHVDKNFRQLIQSWQSRFQRVHRQPEDLIFEDSPITQAQAVGLIECQMSSRWLDFVARELKAEGESFYTIGSSGHEGNAMVGMCADVEDMAFLHYRSGGFVMARARQVAGQTPIFDTCLSLTASSEDPISGGRHKVWGSKTLNIPPQTSTIASHLPKAMGYAFFLDRRHPLDLEVGPEREAIAICTFGDASSNHSTAVGAINAAAWAAYQNIPMPVLFVCEDNGIGISVHTPPGWVAANYQNRAGLKYFRASGLDFRSGFGPVQEAIRYCRERRRPVFLHLETVRMLGHAGSDVESVYNTTEFVEAQEAKDPLLKSAERLMEAGVLSPEELMAMYENIAEQVRAAGREATQRPKHMTAETVVKPLEPDYSELNLKSASIPTETRREHFNGTLPEEQRPRHLAQHINWALHDLFLAQDDLFLFGEDVARKGGVYNVTTQLFQQFGAGRVFNSLLDEQAILGLAMGAGHLGLLPMPEIQYLAYVHNALDQLRGEACSLGFFSENRFQNPMVVRIAGFAYQKGFGGHFHNDNSFAALRDIPSLIMVTASNGPDAARLLRTSVQMAKQFGSVVVFIEPIALYMTKDLVENGDYLAPYPPPDALMPFGESGFYGEPDAPLLIISYANGTYLSRQAAHDLAQQGIKTQILDLRFLKPLNVGGICAAARGKKGVLIVDECRKTGSISEEIMTHLEEQLGSEKPVVQRIYGHDTYIPLGRAWEYVLPSRESIVAATHKLWEAIHG